MGLIVLSSNIDLPLNTIVELEDKYTKNIAKAQILREATVEEYLKDPPQEPLLTGKYYLVSID